MSDEKFFNVVSNLVIEMKKLFMDNYELYIGKKDQGPIDYYDYDSEWEISKKSYLIEENNYFNDLIEVKPTINKCYSIEEAWSDFCSDISEKARKIVYNYEVENKDEDEYTVEDIINYYNIC